MKKSFLTIIPVFNEKETVEGVVRKTLDYSAVFSDILLINDGSTDGTREVLDQLEKKYTDVKVINKQENSGYGASLISGFQFALERSYSFWTTMDCDEQHQPKDLIRFKEFSPEVDLVSGSRYHPDSGIQGIPAPEDRVEINQRITFLINKAYQLGITDSFCGFKRYKREAFLQHKFSVKGYSSPLELWAYVHWKNLSLRELPVDKIYITDDRSFGEDLDRKRKRYRYYLRTWYSVHKRLTGTDLGFRE